MSSIGESFGPASEGIKKSILNIFSSFNNDETIKPVPSVPTSMTPQFQGKGEPSFSFGTYLNNAKTIAKHSTFKEGAAELATTNSATIGKDGLISTIKTSILKPSLMKSAAASIFSAFNKSQDSIPDPGK